MNDVLHVVMNGVEIGDMARTSPHRVRLLYHADAQGRTPLSTAMPVARRRSSTACSIMCAPGWGDSPRRRCEERPVGGTR